MNRSAVSWDDRLPKVTEFALRPWPETFGADYYGALIVAAEYCGLDSVPRALPGTWQHGYVPPWEQVKPETIVFLAPREMPCFVGRRDEVNYLKGADYSRVQAIGLPILYTDHSGCERVKDSLLVMPPHSLPTWKAAPSAESYVSEIASIRQRFDQVVACVSANCIDNNYWVAQFADYGIPVIRGAGISDANALRRLRMLFETFEYVTTSQFGSHVAYALYYGAKVSLWGEPPTPVLENLLSDGTWASHPDALDRLLSSETAQEAEKQLARFRVNPWEGFEDRAAGGWMLGEENKLPPAELLKAFGWTLTQRAAAEARHIVRGTGAWRLAAGLKRALCSVMQKSI